MLMIVVSFLLYFGISEKSTKTGEMTSYEYELQKGSISLSATTARPFHILSFRSFCILGFQRNVQKQVKWQVMNMNCRKAASLSATTARPFHILSFRTSRITPTQSEATNYCCIPACFICHNTAKPKKTFCVTMTTTVGRVIPKHFSAKRKKNKRWRQSKQQCDSVLYVFFLQISLQWGKRWLTGPLHFILHF